MYSGFTMPPSYPKIELRDLNTHIKCTLCKGYYIDATTIIECLHSFCKTCIVSYLEKNKFCPICDVQIHKTKPLINIRSDQTLQDIVYKLVPGLFKTEMKRRRDFFAQHPEALSNGAAVPTSSEGRGEVLGGERLIFTPEDFINISMECCPPMETVPPQLNFPANNTVWKGQNRRYFRCPGGLTVAHLKKLLRNKNDLSTRCPVDIFYIHDLLDESYTMIDLAYIYSWRRNGDLRLIYRVRETQRGRSEKPQVPENVREYSEQEPFPVEIVQRELDSIAQIQEIKESRTNEMTSDLRKIPAIVPEANLTPDNCVAQIPTQLPPGVLKDPEERDRTPETNLKHIVKVPEKPCEMTKTPEMMRLSEKAKTSEMKRISETSRTPEKANKPSPVALKKSPAMHGNVSKTPVPIAAQRFPITTTTHQSEVKHFRPNYQPSHVTVSLTPNYHVTLNSGHVQLNSGTVQNPGNLSLHPGNIPVSLNGGNISLHHGNMPVSLSNGTISLGAGSVALAAGNIPMSSSGIPMNVQLNNQSLNSGNMAMSGANVPINCGGLTFGNGGYNPGHQPPVADQPHRRVSDRGGQRGRRSVRGRPVKNLPAPINTNPSYSVMPPPPPYPILRPGVPLTLDPAFYNQRFFPPATVNPVTQLSQVVAHLNKANNNNRYHHNMIQRLPQNFNYLRANESPLQPLKSDHQELVKLAPKQHVEKRAEKHLSSSLELEKSSRISPVCLTNNNNNNENSIQESDKPPPAKISRVANYLAKWLPDCEPTSPETYDCNSSPLTEKPPKEGEEDFVIDLAVPNSQVS